ncbi:hypothetical protein RQP54_09970 [Curvibacter sp. APW13]|uniref:hypothetical protein n=1 Tax=Curvibacter sp. APW13 TaxID=3077236 RepID=UPI0028E003E0|nr:hypothetical protein [Curvibacter sp. APW13]MDT8991190.1 hypothetical protein [Curvibacter sp. APW13]
MQENITVHDEQRRRLMLLGAGAAVVGGWACATASSVPKAPPMIQQLAAKGEPRLREKLVAIGRPHPLLNRAMNINDGWMSVLIGMHGTYLISNYGAYNFMQNDGWEDPRLQLEADSELLHIDNKGAVKGWLKIVSNESAGSASDRMVLTKLGFNLPDIGAPFRWLEIGGVVLRPLRDPITAATNPDSKNLTFRAPKIGEPDQFSGLVFANSNLNDRLTIKNQVSHKKVFGLPFFEVTVSS